ncbi:hypothetical protein B0H10DRAFT_1961826 [Mycena sp. CBHHK59/15]|nr:hypothetical protein B0H10DRAFT_1961826 [Mycena sp. CBHHK59/15]
MASRASKHLKTSTYATSISDITKADLIDSDDDDDLISTLVPSGNSALASSLANYNHEDSEEEEEEPYNPAHNKEGEDDNNKEDEGEEQLEDQNEVEDEEEPSVTGKRKGGPGKKNMHFWDMSYQTKKTILLMLMLMAQEIKKTKVAAAGANIASSILTKTTIFHSATGIWSLGRLQS